MKFANTIFFRTLVKELGKGKDEQLFKDLQRIGGFTAACEKSNAYTSGSGLASRKQSGCNCSADLEFESSKLDAFYMLDIGNWTIKVDYCNDRTFALYKPFFTASQLHDKISQLNDSSFQMSHGLCLYSFDYDMLEEIDFLEDSINGSRAGRRSRDVAAGNRSGWIWPHFVINVTVSTFNNGQPFEAKVPAVHVFYGRGWSCGRMKAFL